MSEIPLLLSSLGKMNYNAGFYQLLERLHESGPGDRRFKSKTSRRLMPKVMKILKRKFDAGKNDGWGKLGEFSFD